MDYNRGDLIETGDYKAEVIHVLRRLPFLYICIKDNGDMVMLNADLSEYDKEKPQPYKRWRAEEGEEYWYNNELGFIIQKTERGNIIDDINYTSGNYKADASEIKIRNERLLATQELKDLGEGYEFRFNESNYNIAYDHQEKKFCVFHNSRNSSQDVDFATKEKAQHAIDTLGETKLKIIFEVK